jgi:hypothetical protein
MTIDAKELREAIEHVRTRETWNISLRPSRTRLELQ